MQTKILKLSQINEAVDILKKGGVIVYPTETSYGIGADWTNKKAVNSIFKIKSRPKEKKLVVLISDLKMAKKYLKLNKDHEKLIKKFMPGPLNLISLDKIAFRISSNKMATKIVKKLNKPLTSTSANLSGMPGIYKIKDVISVFNGKVDAIVNGGNLKKRKPSTIYDVKNKIVIRKGSISEKAINKSL